MAGEFLNQSRKVGPQAQEGPGLGIQTPGSSCANLGRFLLLPRFQFLFCKVEVSLWLCNQGKYGSGGPQESRAAGNARPSRCTSR